ncbi:hypothetical protein LIER_15810 [Lithospermum erythrorhizon]|uniref:Uncharacterized protein n=1 Tax=Lithospermum erythrorhizon TaxID=34254 RepID=A0AAV3Q7G7_LITER
MRSLCKTLASTKRGLSRYGGRSWWSNLLRWLRTSEVVPLPTPIPEAIVNVKNGFDVLDDDVEDNALSKNATKMVSNGCRSMGKTIVKPAKAQVGRICVCWNPQYVSCDMVTKDDQHILVRVRGAGMCDMTFFLSVVYGSNNREERKALWTSLKQVEGHVSCLPWLLGEDFNVIRAS